MQVDSVRFFWTYQMTINHELRADRMLNILFGSHFLMVIQCLGLVPLSPGPWPLEFNLTTFLSEKVSCNTILAGCVTRVPVSLRGLGWGFRVCSLDVASASATVCDRPQPLATVHNCPREGPIRPKSCHF